MLAVWIYSIVSVVIISLVSLIGVFTLSIKPEKLKKLLIYFVSFSAGALFGGAFLHLLPEIIEEVGFSIRISTWLLLGIVVFFILEKVIHWNHCHMPITKTHVHSYSIMNLIGDAFHNLLDGLIIGASYLVSIPVGISTSLAVLFHEIPQEIGDFGVLLHGGFTKTRALLLNFLVALVSVVGVIIALVISSHIENLATYLVPFAAGGFIYIAGSDLIPELHKECELNRSLPQLLFLIIGILVMYALLYLG